jgi:hypothetical protein
VRIVGRDDGQSELLAQREDPLVEASLAGRVVRLYLEVVAAREQVGVPAGGTPRALEVVVEEVRGDLSSHACRRDDQPLAVAGEELPVDARLDVKALGVGQRRELDEVAVARGVLGEQDEVVVWLRARRRPRAGPAISRRDVCFHTDDRLQSGLPRLLLEFPRAVEISMIGDREGRLLELEGPGDQVVDPVGAVEQRVLGMTVKVDEGHHRVT